MPENPYGNLGSWDEQAANPAAPEGQRQAATAGKGFEDQSNPYSNLGKWMSSTEENPYTANAASWYTGFNAEGTNNGWDTDFTNRFITGQNEAAKAGTLSNYFEQADATGVVTWDHKSADGRHEYRFGDIFDNGQKVGNVYDLYDKGDADLSMVPWLFDGKQQARMFSDSDATSRIASEVEGMRTKNNTEIPKALAAAEFQGSVDERAESIGEGKTGAALVAGAAAGGAATGASAGALLTAWAGPGAAAGAAAGGIVGAIAGGVGGFFNRDELAEQAARAYEITALSTEQNGDLAGVATGVKEWAGFSTHLTSPLQQVTHGLTEFSGDNKAGDGKSAFHAVDDKGEGTAPVWAKVASLGAAVGDGLLQFISPLNRAVYMGQMGATIGGEVAQLGMTGTMFDQQQGGFDNIFKDDQGNADPGSAAAGILKIGIDAIQLGGISALARVSGIRGAAAEAGERSTELVGHRFLLNEAGEVVGKQKTIALLAPSEQVAYASAARSARVAALKDGRAVSADDLYRAAERMATGSNKVKVALVNGFGEGYEEVVQTISETVALDNDFSMQEIRTAFLYGAAGGIGMSMGATFAGPGQDEQLSAQAYAVETLRRGEAPDRAAWDTEWAAKTAAEKRVAANRSPADVSMMREALGRMAKDQSATLVASEVDAAKAIDSRKAMIDRELNRASEKTDTFHVMSGLLSAGRVSPTGDLLGDTAPAEAVEGSALTIYRLLENRLKGLGLQEQTMADRAKALAASSSDPAVQAKIDEATAMVNSIALSRQVGEAMLADVADILDAVYDPSTTEDEGERYVRSLNAFLEQVFRGTAQVTLPEGSAATPEELALAGAQFATLLQSREPKLDAGSYLALLPRASWELTRTRSDNLLQVNTDILQAINGDFDGDKLRAENQLILSPERFAQARSGQNLAGSGTSIDIGVRNFDAALSEAVAAGLVATGTLQAEARAVLANIETALTHRYGNLMSPEAMGRVMDEFRTSLEAGSEEARTTLLNGLAREAGQAITDFGKSQMTNEWLWASKVVRANLQAYQANYRVLRDQMGTAPAAPTTGAITYQVVQPWLVLAYQGSTPVGYMSWNNPGDGAIQMVGVVPEVRRKGIASGMKKAALDAGHDVRHSTSRSAAGDAWAKAVSGGTAPAVEHELGIGQMGSEETQVADIRERLAEYVAAYGQPVATPRNLGVSGPSETADVADISTPEGTNRRKARAVNDAQTLALFAAGNTLFRKFQKIHYTFFNASVLQAAQVEPADLFEMARTYEELGRGVTRAELDRVAGTDTIAARVMVMLRRLVEDALDDPDMGAFSPTTAMSVLANVKVKDVWFAETGEPVTDGRDLSLVQLLLKRALDADRQEHARTFDTDEKLQAKHARLRGLTIPNETTDGVNAQKAFLEVFGSTPFIESLGGVTGELAPHTTPEQWLRSYTSLDANGRREWERLFTNVPEYLNRKETSNPPYSLAEASRREVSAYRSMIDAMLAVGRAMPVERAKVSKMAETDFVETHQLVRQALADFRKGTGRRSKDRALSAELVQTMLEQNPQFGRQVLATIPDAAANALFEYRDGQLFVVPWIYEMFAIEKPEEAAFFYWKNLTLAQWFSTQGTIHEDDADAPGRAYNKLQSRFQRLMYQFAKEPGQPRLEQLVRKMDESKSIDAFFDWLNTTAGMRGNYDQAPLLAFNDDVADFEADAGGGWVTARASGDLRAAITAMRRGAEQLRDTMKFREETAATDRMILDGIKRALANDPAATPLEHENLLKLRKAVAASREVPRGFAPSAMLALSRGAIRGFDAQSHDKGRTATSYGPLGEFQALMDAYAFVPGLERVMETLTAHSIGSLRTNLGDTAKHGGTAMDANGRPIEWEAMSVEQAVEMLDDSRTAPLAHLLLTPTALDLTPAGTLSERSLMEASLKDLLDDSHYKELFRGDGILSLDQAMRYISLVDSRARVEGGSFDAIRAVHDLAIARTSSLGRPATEDDNDRLVKQAYIEVARVLQMVGRLQATPETRDARALEALRNQSVATLKSHQQARALPAFTDSESGMVIEEWVEQLLSDLAIEEQTLLDSLVDLYEGDELTRRSAALRGQYQQNEERIRSVLAADQAGAVVARFRVTGDAALDRAAHAQIVDYVRSMASFPARASESAEIWAKLANQLTDGLEPDLSADEWAQLSRSAMGVYLADEVIRVSGHVSLPPFAKGDPAESDARFYKYFDPSFSYLATDLLQEDTPLAAAAVWLHTMAEQPRDVLPVDSLARTMNHTILNRAQLGTWTPGLMSQIVETHQRMDSAAAGQAIAAAGNGPKRWAAIMAATRRTTSTKVPTPDLLTPVTLEGGWFAEDVSRFSEFPVTPAGATEPATMPLSQLDNRFFAEVKINGVSIPLDSENLGFRWDAQPEDTPYRYVGLDRLRAVVARAAKQQSLPLSQVVVEVSFFHPDSQPEGPEWMNNAFFEGMSHSLLPDGSESLLATLWSDNGGMISLDTQRPLDAGKKGLRAIQPFKRLDDTAVAEAEALWSVGNDMAAMLRRKTELVMTYDDGSGVVDPSYFNAVYKHMKLQHLVVGTIDGKPAALTAEQVIAHQASNGRTTPLPLDDARLVTISPDVLRTMLGETGDQGVDRFFDDEYLLNPDLVRPYTEITEQMLERFGAGWVSEPGKLGDTALANVGQQRVMTVRQMLTDAERNARQDRILHLNARSAEVRAARYSKLRGADARQGYLTALKLASGAVTAERSTFDFVEQGIPIAPRNIGESAHSKRLLQAREGVAERDNFERGWHVIDQGGPDYPGGVLTVESLDADRPLEHHVVKDDLAFLDLATFERPERDVTQVEARVEKALRHLANSGATVVIGNSNGGGDLRFHAAQYLRDLGYAPVAGSRHLYSPIEFSLQTQNERAYESTLTETKRIRPARNAVVFLALDPIGTDENNAILNPRSMKLRDRKLLNNILPSSSFPNYNVPLEDNRDNGLYARALAHLRTVLSPANTEARALLVEMAGADPARVMPIADALDRFHARISNRATLEPQVGDPLEVGDIIPFVHSDGRVILYRHGFKMVKTEADARELQAKGGLNVALAKSETEPAATANSGTIVSIEDRAVFGRTLALETPLQAYGNKLQLEWNGMKYVVVPGDDDTLGNPGPVFANGTLVDLFSDAASAASKEAFEGRVFGYRNALAFFQFDFTDDLVDFFFPDAGARDPQARLLTINLLHRLANQRDLEIPLAEANALAKSGIAVADLLGTFAAHEADRSQVDTSWVERLADPTDASGQIAKAVITYLLTPGAHVDNVLKSAGFSHPQAHTDSVTTRLVPGIFADLLDNGLDSLLHTELIRRFDAQLMRNSDGSGFKLHPNWMVELFDATGGTTRGYLQFGEAHSSGDNPRLDGQAFDINEAQAVSPHNAMAAANSLGAVTAHKLLKKSQAFARSFARGAGVGKPGSGDSLWDMLTALPTEKDDTFAGWRRETPAETLRRAAAREELVGFHHELNTDDWTQAQRDEYKAEAVKILDRLNLYGTQVAMVDSWVRDHLGSPHGLDEFGKELGVISGPEAIETLKVIRSNISKGQLPHAKAFSPLIDVNHLTAIYLANLNRTDGRGWAPKEPGGAEVASWDGWVETAFGTAWIMAEGEQGVGPEPLFDQLYLLAVDGRMHGYQGATTSTRYLPVSSDILRQRQLMHPDTNRMLVSLSADENLLATDPALFNASRAELDDIIGGQRLYADGRRGPDPASAAGRKAKYIDRWRNEVDAPRQVGKQMRGVRASGQSFLGHTTTTSSFWRCVINWRVGKSLFNVALVVSAPIEAFYRRTINTVAQVATGESTGAVGALQGRIADRYADTTIGGIAAQLGLTPAYTTQQRKDLNVLVDALSTRNDFKSMVYKELMFQYPSMPGIGRIEKALERFAKFGGRLQDPAWGMLPKDLARIYVEAAMQKLAHGGENIYSADRMLKMMARNPQWLQTNDLEAHNLAIARISNIRSVKPNVLSLGFRGITEPLAESPKFLANTAGNMLRVMTVFQNFWSNYAINIAGLQGAADFAAFMVDGKEKSRLVRRMQSAMRGEVFTDEAEHYDMSEVLESLDLADSFIRGGVTHTALFALGMAAGGLGLSGGDDETKWRRRQAALQGAGMVMDPREIENDFRNRDSIYLNWLPMGLDSLFRVDPTDEKSESMAQMNWITRALLSPVIGFERFYETGDFTEVVHGFKDAIGAHPIVNDQLWNAATDTVAELHTQAVKAEENGDHPAANHFLVTAVGVLDSLLLENSMINMIYVGSDRYDRDPYALPQLDSDQNPQGDVRGNPYETDALTSFEGEDGHLQQGYVARDAHGAALRSLTENRFSLALVGSLFTGLTGGGFTSSDMYRQNMVVKERTVELQPTDTQVLKSELLAAFQGSGADTPLLTGNELSQVWKNQAADADRFVDWGELENRANVAAEQGLYGTGVGVDLSTLDQAGNEELTLAGKQAVVEGLRRGMVKLGDDALAGVFITEAQRNEIQTQWMEQLTQQGVDLGLSPSQAASRMKRIFFGEYGNAEATGIYDVLWSKDIPGSDSVKYNQLNTTYVMGPSGFPMATGFTRDGLFGALGLKPVNRLYTSVDTGQASDTRGNTVDGVTGINTGLRGLELRPQGWEIATPEEEIRAAAEKIADAIGKMNFQPQQPYEKKDSGNTPYKKSGYSGGYSGGGYSDFVKMYSLPHNITTYGNSIPFINTSNPIIRRTYVRRERVWSERGRLKQWQ